MRTIIETGLFLSGGFLISILQGLILIPNILLISYKKRLFDHPDERKVHSIPVPRLGGISFFPAILVSLCLIIGLFHCVGIPIARLLTDRSLLEFLFWVSGCMLLYLIGVADDLVGVGYRYKFVVQVFTAILLVLPGAWINSLGGLFGIYMLPSWVGIPLTVLIVVYITNAINLIDGIDGLASGLSCIALTRRSWFLFLMSFVWCCIDYVKAGIPSYRIRITSIISCCGLVCVSVRYW
ncbi:MraY family glycosyltransferase [Parabacteroides distasonis]|nr:MraY family glycosyltransferase [Parabacteroides distasonis]MDB9152007.1 MraY family glycosyltransferase [Parabacteroides distasonis]MDB9156562.1 MraY family glycosyltransferase [Parabacteroides distasonis]MDB9165689.1 MraY family glycosyltransferase [Parabacteroides distasonis]MDB9170095.1 MraY family glycosyltransferase [Parabacteroides distasonis]MDB9193250.1 MraY family glycosyltransferase [Parabacteroides distasonis]